MEPIANEDCVAFVDEKKVSKWSHHYKIYFHIPDRSIDEETLVEVSMPDHEVQDCWGIVEHSLKRQSDGISFRLPIFKSGAADVGCVMAGEYPGGEAFQIKYHGSHCFANPPPPPIGFASCPVDLIKFRITGEWSGGMQGRITLKDSLWVRGLVVKLAFGVDGLAEDEVDVDRCYNAEFLEASPEEGTLSFRLPGIGTRECGEQSAEAISDTEHQCFEFHITKKPARTNQLKLLCPAHYPSPPPPSVPNPLLPVASPPLPRPQPILPPPSPTPRRPPRTPPPSPPQPLYPVWSPPPLPPPLSPPKLGQSLGSFQDFLIAPFAVGIGGAGFVLIAAAVPICAVWRMLRRSWGSSNDSDNVDQDDSDDLSDQDDDNSVAGFPIEKKRPHRAGNINDKE